MSRAQGEGEHRPVEVVMLNVWRLAVALAEEIDDR